MAQAASQEPQVSTLVRLCGPLGLEIEGRDVDASERGAKMGSSAAARLSCRRGERRLAPSAERARLRRIWVYQAKETEGEGFEPSGDVTAANGFRDRSEGGAIPHHNWNQHRGGIPGGMNLSRRV